MYITEDNALEREEIIEFEVETSYGKLHLYKRGTGKQKVVLLHGSGCDSAMLSWREVMNTFGKEYTIFAPDLLGYGKSEQAKKIVGEAFYPTHIASIKEMVDALKLEHFSLAGLSMGGAIAIGFALAYPEKVQVLLPVDSWGLTAKLPMHTLSYWLMQKTNITLNQYHWIAKNRWGAKWLVGYALMGNKHKITEAIVDEVWEACKRKEAGKSMQDYQRSSCSKQGAIPYYKKELVHLKMPVIFINGEKDQLVRAKQSEWAANQVPNGQFYCLKGCKHWSVKEEPAVFYKIVDEACNKLEE